MYFILVTWSQNPYHTLRNKRWYEDLSWLGEQQEFYGHHGLTADSSQIFPALWIPSRHPLNEIWSWMETLLLPEKRLKPILKEWHVSKLQWSDVGTRVAIYIYISTRNLPTISKIWADQIWIATVLVIRTWDCRCIMATVLEKLETESLARKSWC